MNEMARWAHVIVSFVLLASCGAIEESERAREGDAAADAAAAGAQADAAIDDDAAHPGCVIAADGCFPADRCCPPVIGRLLDLERGCLHDARIILACDRKPGLATSACVSDDGIGCWMRPSEAGVETFLTSENGRDDGMAGLTRCTPELYKSIQGMNLGTCR